MDRCILIACIIFYLVDDFFKIQILFFSLIIFKTCVELHLFFSFIFEEKNSACDEMQQIIERKIFTTHETNKKKEEKNNIYIYNH